MTEKQIIDSLKKNRLSKGMTQADLASKLKITKQALQQLENGRNKLTLQRLIDICKSLKVKLIIDIK